MHLDSYFVTAPKIRPQMNIGCLFDIPNGRYLEGPRGESILNGGLPYVTGVGGRGNMFKSVITHFMLLTVLDRYRRTKAEFYDTETSLSIARLTQLSQNMDNIAGVDLEDEGRLHLTDNTVMSGNEWFFNLKKLAEDKKKNAKEFMATTPFIDDKTKKPIMSWYPTLVELDSLSMFITDSVEGIYEKNQIGDSAANTDSLRGAAANTDSLRGAAAKSQMLMQIPTLTGQAGIYMAMTMHVGDQHVLDAYAPQKKALTFLKGGVSFKHVPQKITFLTNNLWYATNVALMLNKGTKAPEYPRDKHDNMENDPDLQVVTILNLRAKNGPTGLPFEVVVSQSEGVLVGLTEFNYIKAYDRFGLGGHDRAYFLELLPEVTMQRTTIRGLIYENPALRRALTITSEMCQMKNLWDDTDGDFCSPKELYEDLKAKGYDWARLLATRGYWVFEDDAQNELPFLSTKDLLRMRKGEYHPYWYGKLEKKAA